MSTPQKVVFVGYSEAQRRLLFQGDGLFATLEHTIKVNGADVHLSCNATACGSEFDSVRPVCYVNARTFVLLYDATSSESLFLVKHKWFPEVRYRYRDRDRVLLFCSVLDRC